MSGTLTPSTTALEGTFFGGSDITAQGLDLQAALKQAQDAVAAANAALAAVTINNYTEEQLRGQGFTYRGQWAANTTYNPYDVFSENNAVYEVSVGFTSGATFDATKANLWVRGSTGSSSAGSLPTQSATPSLVQSGTARTQNATCSVNLQNPPAVGNFLYVVVTGTGSPTNTSTLVNATVSSPQGNFRRGYFSADGYTATDGQPTVGLLASAVYSQKVTANTGKTITVSGLNIDAQHSMNVFVFEVSGTQRFKVNSGAPNISGNNAVIPLEYVYQNSMTITTIVQDKDIGTCTFDSNGTFLQTSTGTTPNNGANACYIASGNQPATLTATYQSTPDNPFQYVTVELQPSYSVAPPDGFSVRRSLFTIRNDMLRTSGINQATPFPVPEYDNINLTSNVENLGIISLPSGTKYAKISWMLVGFAQNYDTQIVKYVSEFNPPVPAVDTIQLGVNANGTASGFPGNNRFLFNNAINGGALGSFQTAWFPVTEGAEYIVSFSQAGGAYSDIILAGSYGIDNLGVWGGGGMWWVQIEAI